MRCYGYLKSGDTIESPDHIADITLTPVDTNYTVGEKKDPFENHVSFKTLC